MTTKIKFDDFFILRPAQGGTDQSSLSSGRSRLGQNKVTSSLNVVTFNDVAINTHKEQFNNRFEAIVLGYREYVTRKDRRVTPGTSETKSAALFVLLIDHEEPERELFPVIFEIQEGLLARLMPLAGGLAQGKRLGLKVVNLDTKTVRPQWISARAEALNVYEDPYFESRDAEGVIHLGWVTKNTYSVLLAIEDAPSVLTSRQLAAISAYSRVLMMCKYHFSLDSLVHFHGTDQEAFAAVTEVTNEPVREWLDDGFNELLVADIQQVRIAAAIAVGVKKVEKEHGETKDTTE